MGQYFILVNLDKREWFSPYRDRGAKFLSWFESSVNIIAWLLRQSNEGGGGDINANDYPYAGRWASDKITLVGDYDDSKLYQTAIDTYTNISDAVLEEIGEFGI